MIIPAPSIMHPWCLEASGLVFAKLSNALADGSSAAWPSSATALYFPFVLAVPALATKALVYNGSVASLAMDVGVYDSKGTRLTSTGSTAQTGTNVGQEIDMADVFIGPGLFYMAIAMDNATGTTFRGNTGGTSSGAYKQDNAFPLPANATFATYDITSYIPVFGIALDKTLT